MNSDLLIACIIAGGFFVSMIAFFVSGFIGEYRRVERSRRNGMNAWVFTED